VNGAARAPWRVTANPGGPIDPEDHIGHERELHEVLLSVAAVGALVPGDRRMGKTSLLRKAEQLLTEHVVVRISAETVKLDLFGPRLLQTLRGHRIFADELNRWKVDVDVGYQGIRLRRRSSDGTAKADDSDDLFTWAASRAAPTKLVIIIDEVTVLLTAIELEHPGGAAEFLRSLRRPRQELPNVAVILSGSIGLHHAVRDMAPVNDLRNVRIGPLAPADAVFLSRCLLLGEGIETDDEAGVSAAMAHATDGVPYFLHHVAAEAARRGGVLTAEGVADIRQAALSDPDDPWHLRHYRERISLYYGADAELVLELLDAYARAEEPLDLDAVARSVQSVASDHRPTRDELIRLVESLETDSYLTRRGNADEFAFRLLRDAWRTMRRLG